ncbi:MAG: hypothetical protein ACI4L9_06985, partial [Candidatus Coproplasma sp.]
REIIIRINPTTNEWEYKYEGEENWTSLGVKATGSDGADGRGIVRIEKTATVGLVDTYTIYYSDDTTSTFTVTNGQNGGADGADGQDGITPHIGTNGNWYIGETDTGVKAVGTDGATGATGAAGADGADGREIIIRINPTTNEWEYKYEGEENWTSLGVVATGEKGDKGENGENGEDGKTPKLRINEATNEWEVSYDDGETWTSLGIKATGVDGSDGTDGKDGSDGKDGADGKTPQLRINETTNEWEVSYDEGGTWTSLGVKAIGEKGDKGDKGEDGRGIVSVEKTCTDGLIDVYTITFTDGTSTTFLVTNGADGKYDSTPYVGDNGNWWVGAVDSGVYAAAPEGTVTQLRVNSETKEWEVSSDDGISWASLGVKPSDVQNSAGLDGFSITAIVACVVAGLAIAVATAVAVLAIRDKKRMQAIIESLNGNGENS